MKITKVEVIPVTFPMKREMHMPGTVITEIPSVVCKIHTDEGLVGISDSGDTSSWYRGETQDSMTSMIIDYIAPRALLGQDPTNIQRIVGLMDTYVRDNSQAKAVVDFALHDLKGKVYNMPVYQLLGGKCADYSVQGWVTSSGPAQTMITESLEALKQGFCLIKLKIGAPTIDEDVRSILAVREAIGDDVRLTVDVNGFWNYDQALKAFKKLDAANLECVEQPLPYWDIEGLAKLRGKIGTPVFADEAAQDLHHLKQIIDLRAADGLFIKLQKAGGLLKAQRFLTLARLGDLPVMCGCMIGSGLEGSPSAHLMIADQWAAQFTHENLGLLTIHNQWENEVQQITEDIALNPPVYRNGKLYPNEGPGFGIELNEDAVAKYTAPGRAARAVTL
jgi:L-Ala-D/L-Glu epimerase / N-acetyl-D-glutamate racemase